MEPAAGVLIALAGTLGAQTSAPDGLATLVAEVKECERLAKIGNAEQARAQVEFAIAQLVGLAEVTREAERARALRDAGALAYNLRSLEPARAAWQYVRAFRERTLPPDDLEVQNARGNVAWIGEQLGFVAEARAIEEQVVAALERTQPADHEALLIARANLGDTLLALGEPDRALELFRQVAEVRRAKLPPGHAKVLRAELDLACGLVGTAAVDEAAGVLRAVLAVPDADRAIAIRACVDLAFVEAARGDTKAFSAVARQLATLLERAVAEAQTEAQRMEIAPAIDALISCALGLGVTAENQGLVHVAARIVAPEAPSHCVVFHRLERSALSGTGRACSVLAEERLGVFLVVPDRPTRWLDLGAASLIRDAAQRWFDTSIGDGKAAEERIRGEELAQLVLTPLRKAMPETGRLTIVPDDVVWAIPFTYLPYGSGRAMDELRIDLVDPTTLVKGDRARGQRVVVVADPQPRFPVPVPDAGLTRGAAVFLAVDWSEPVPGAAGELRPRSGSAPLEGPKATWTALARAAPEAGGLVLVVPAWAAPKLVPCITTPRAVVARATLAAALVREDVIGGSSPARLCGLGFAGYEEPLGTDGYLHDVAAAADLRDLDLSACELVVIAVPPPRGDVRMRARDVAALSSALHAAGARRVAILARQFSTEWMRPLGNLEIYLEKTGTPELLDGLFQSGDWLCTRSR